MKFGYVYPGQTIPALYSNLVRAPLFRQKPYPTDFLVVRFDTNLIYSHHLFLADILIQEYRQGRDQIFLARNQKPLRRRTNISCHRSPWTALAKDNKYY